MSRSATRIGWSLIACLTLLGAAAPISRAQPYTLRGHVADAETGDALVGVHVFIASSMLGTVTDDAGRFVLARVPSGAHTLYVSMLGFEPERREVRLPDAADSVFTFRLKPRVVQIGGVTVEDKRDRRWPRRLRKFERLFLGETPNAEQTTILNPEVLDFEASWWGRFRASASEPLVLENRALGYRITYFLKEFESAGGTLRYDGEPLFEELTPESPEQAAAWEQARRDAYQGSFRHFLLSLLDDRCADEGFAAYNQIGEDRPRRGHVGFPVRARRVLRDGERPDEKLLRFYGFMQVIYLDEDEDRSYLFWANSSGQRAPGPQHSWLELNDGPTAIDETGEVIDPYGVTVYGYFAFERMADLVPKEYRPTTDAP